MRVGVIGIGGLGHMALQFAKAWGCEVTAFSTSPAKEGDTQSFGADRFVDATDRKAVKAMQGSLDFILSTATVDLRWQDYVDALRPDGRLCVVGASPGNFEAAAISLLGGRKSVCGSPTGSRRQMTEMLDFAARHGITAQTEDEIRAALGFAQESGVPIVIEGARDAGYLADEIAAAGVPVVYSLPWSPSSRGVDRGKDEDARWYTFDAPARLVAAGVPVAITGSNPSSNPI